MRGEIAVLKQQPDLDPMDIQSIEVAEGRVKQASEEAGKPEPSIHVIKVAVVALDLCLCQMISV